MTIHLVLCFDDLGAFFFYRYLTKGVRREETREAEGFSGGYGVSFSFFFPRANIIFLLCIFCCSFARVSSCGEGAEGGVNMPPAFRYHTGLTGEFGRN